MTQTTDVERRAPRTHPVAGTFLAVTGGLVWVLPAAVAVFIVPKFVALFEETDAELPAVSAAVLAGAKAVFAWWPLAVLALLLAVGGLVALSVTVRGPWPVALAGTFAGLSVLGMGVALLLTVVALFLPMQALLDDLSHG
jgi:hypothetical protein